MYNLKKDKNNLPYRKE